MGKKRVVSSQEFGKTRVEISHLLKLPETQGRFLIPEECLFAARNVQWCWPLQVGRGG